MPWSDDVGGRVVYTANFSKPVSGVTTSSFLIDSGGLLGVTSFTRPHPSAMTSSWELVVDVPVIDRNTTLTVRVPEYAVTIPAANMHSQPVGVTMLRDHFPGCWMRYACTYDCVTERPFLPLTVEAGEMRLADTLAFPGTGFLYAWMSDNMTVEVDGFTASCGHLRYSVDVVLDHQQCSSAQRVADPTAVEHLLTLMEGPAGGVVPLTEMALPELTDLRARITLIDVHRRNYTFCSRPFMVDTTPPVAGTVVDLPVHINSLVDIDNQAETDSVRASWPGWSDDTPLRFRYKIGTTPGGEELVPWTDTNTTTHALVRGLRLQQHWTVYWTVEGRNAAGLTTTVSSDGVFIDSTQPVAAPSSVSIVGPVASGGVTVRGNTSVTAVWVPFMEDGSPVIGYHASVGLCGADPRHFVLDAADVGVVYSATFSNLRVVPGTLYCVYVTATNDAGVTTTEVSNPFAYDSTAPDAVDVVVGPTLGASIPHTRNGHNMSASWHFVDTDYDAIDSGFDYVTYEWAIGTEGDMESVRPFTPVEASVAAATTGLALVERTYYYVTVRATNVAGHSSMHTSAPMLFDSAVPDATSSLHCASELEPTTSIRVGEEVTCTVVPRNSGRPIMAYTSDFAVIGGADVVPGANFTVVTVETYAVPPVAMDLLYTASPTAGHHDLSVRPALGAAAGSDIAGSPFSWDIAAKYVDFSSNVTCAPPLGRYGGNIIVRHNTSVVCTVVVAEAGEESVAVAADLSIEAVLGNVWDDLHTSDGGRTWRYTYQAPACGTDDVLYTFAGRAGPGGANIMGSPSNIHLATHPTRATELSCWSALTPSSSVRYNATSDCLLVVKDDMGLAKAVAQDFYITLDNGAVTPLVTDDSGYTFTFSYTAPALGLDNVLTLRLSATNEVVAGGVVHMDLVTFPDVTSSLVCLSPMLIDTEVEYGDSVACTITIRSAGQLLKAVPSDIRVWSTSDASNVTALEVVDGGHQLTFRYLAPGDGRVNFDDINVAIEGGAGVPNAVLDHVTNSPITMTLLVVGASKNSIQSCDTRLVPGTTVRRGTTILCTIAMVDRDGDAVKGDVQGFLLLPEHGTASATRPAGNGRLAVFDYTPPSDPQLFVDTQHAILSLTMEPLTDGSLVFDIADFPDTTTSLNCWTVEVPATTVRAGSLVYCRLTARSGGLDIKAVPADFTVATWPATTTVSPMLVLDGGRVLEFNVTAPPTSDVHDHGMTINTTITDTEGVVDGGFLFFDVAHMPDETSGVECSRFEAAAPVGAGAGLVTLEASGRIELVAEYETVMCFVTPRQNNVDVKALVVDFNATSFNGTLSTFTSEESGYRMRLVYTAQRVEVDGETDPVSVHVDQWPIVDMDGSPVSMLAFAHGVSAPYVRCTSHTLPTSSVRSGSSMDCMVYLDSPRYGADPVTVSGLTAGSITTPPYKHDSTGLTYAFVYNTAGVTPQRNQFQVFVVDAATSTTPVEVSLSPVLVDVAGVASATTSSLACDVSAAFAAVGYLLRSAPVVCTVTVRDAAGVPVPALIADFAVATGGTITEPFSTEDGGLTLNFTVVTPAVGTQFRIVVTETFTDSIIVGGTVASELTDNVAPTWVDGYPVIGGFDKATVTLQLQLDEPGRVHIIAVEAPSPPLGVCDVLPASDTVARAAASCTGSPAPVAASVSVNVNQEATVLEGVVGVDTPLDYDTEYDIWILARDFSLLVNVQAEPVKLSVATSPCVPCSAGFREVVACTSTTDAVCQRQGRRTCGAGWEFGGSGLCFRLVSDAQSAAAGAATCTALGGGLAVAYTSSEASALADLCTGTAVGSTGCWVGAAVHASGEAAEWTTVFRTTTPADARVPTAVSLGTSPTPACGYIASGEWALGGCDTSRAVLCAQPASVNVRSATEELTCSSPGCTATVVVGSYAEPGASVSAASLDLIVQQLDMANADQYVEDVIVNGTRVGDCTGSGDGAPACSVEEWHACGDPLTVPANEYAVEVAAKVTGPVGSSCEVNAFDDGVVFRARATMIVASVFEPAAVVPRAVHVTGGAATVAWGWPGTSGGAGMDEFTVQLGDQQATFVINSDHDTLTNALRDSEQVVVSESRASVAITASCSIGKVAVFGFSLHMATSDTASPPSQCMVDNTKACRPRESTCSQAACTSDASTDHYRVVYLLCQTPDAVPLWASTGSQRLALATDGARPATDCPTNTAVLFGFGFQPVSPSLTAAQAQCARTRSFTCAVGGTSCGSATCAAGSAVGSSIAYSVCAPLGVVDQSVAAATGSAVSTGSARAQLTCPVDHSIGWGFSLHAGLDAAGATDSQRGQCAASHTSACSVGSLSCSPPRCGIAAASQFVTASCVRDSIVNPTFEHTFTGLPPQTALPLAVGVHNLGGFSSETPSGEVVVTTQPSTVPGAPTTPTVDVATGGLLTLSWTPPADTGGSAVNGYELSLLTGDCESLSATPPAWSLLPESAAAAEPVAGAWVASPSSRGAASAFGVVGEWTTVAHVVPNTDADATFLQLSQVDPVIWLRIVVPCNGTLGAAVMEVEVLDADNNNVAVGRPAFASSSASLASAGSYATDGTCGVDCASSAGVWRASCASGGFENVAVVLAEPVEVGSVMVHWGSPMDATSVRASGGFFIQVRTAASASVAFRPSVLGSVEVTGATLHGKDGITSDAVSVLAVSPGSHGIPATAPRTHSMFRLPAAAGEGAALDVTMELWVQVTQLPASGEMALLSADGTNGVVVAINSDGAFVAVDLGAGDSSPGPMHVRVATTADPAIVGMWAHLAVSRSTTNVTALHTGLWVNGTVAAWGPWVHCSTLPPLPGVVATSVFSGFALPPVSPPSAVWNVPNSGTIQLTASVSPPDGALERRNAMLHGATVEVGQLGTAPGLGGHASRLEMTLSASLPSSGAGAIAVAYRTVNPHNYYAVYFGNDCGCTQLLAVEAGAVRVIAASSDFAPSPNTPFTVAVQQHTDGTVVVVVDGADVLSTVATPRFATAASMPATVSFVDTQGSVSDVHVAAQLSGVLFGAPSVSDMRARLARVHLHHRVLPMTEIVAAAASTPDGGSGSSSAMLGGWLTVATDVFADENTASWGGSPKLALGTCGVYDTGDDLVHVLGGGGHGWRGTSGTLGKDAFASKTFDVSGTPHTHARIQLELAYLGLWESGDAATVSVDGNVQWEGRHITGGCAAGWYAYGGFCYRPALDDSGNWLTATSDSAAGNCTAEGAALLNFRDAAEAEFVVATLEGDHGQPPAGRIWTGLGDAAVEGRYEWRDGSLYTHTPWHVDETFGVSAFELDCTVLDWDAALHVEACAARHAYVCKRPVDESQCDDGLPYVVADVTVPHTQSSVKVTVTPRIAGSQEASLVIRAVQVELKTIGAPVAFRAGVTPVMTHVTDNSNTVSVGGLAPTTSYCAAIAASNGVGIGPYGPPATVSTTAVTSPSAPRNLLVAGTTGGSATVTWQPPLDLGGVAIDMYRVFFREAVPAGQSNTATFVAVPAEYLSWSPDTASSERTAATADGQVGATARLAVVGNLTNQVSYEFQLRAVNSNGDGDTSLVTALTQSVSLAEPPRGLRVLSATGSGVTVVWDEPFDDGGAAIQLYTATYSVAGGSPHEADVQPLEPQAAGPYTGGLIQICCYDASTPISVFAVAYNLPDCLDASDTSFTLATNTTDGSAPAPPHSLVPTLVTGGAIHVLWAPNADYGGLAVIDYTVYMVVGSASESSAAVVATVSTPQPVVAGGLSHSTTYRFAVTARNSFGVSALSAWMEVTTAVQQAPAPPTGLELARNSGGSLIAQWVPPVDTGGLPITGYRVFHEADTVRSELTAACATTDGATTCIAYGLTERTLYPMVVVAVNEFGAGAASASASESTPAATTPSVPPSLSLVTVSPCSSSGIVSPPCNPTGGAITLQLGGSVDLGGLPVLSYLVQRQDEDTLAWSDMLTTASAVGVLSGLTPETDYILRQQVTTGAGPSAFSSAVTVSTSVATKPGAVAPPTLSSATGASVCLTWDPPVDNGGSVVVSYTLYTAVSGSTAAQCADSGDTTCIVHSTLSVVDSNGLPDDSVTRELCVGNLKAQSVQRVRLLASNAVGPGPLTGLTAATTTAATEPFAPRSFTVDGVRLLAVDVSWQPPTNDGGATQLFYVLQADVLVPPGAPASDDPPVVVTAPPEATSTAINGLQSDTTYTFTIYLRTSAHNGAVATTTGATAKPGALGRGAFTTTSMTVSEGDATTVIPLRRTGGSSAELNERVFVWTATYTPLSGPSTNVDPDEYSLVGSGADVGDSVTVTFGDAVTEGSVTLQLVDDNLFQQSERLVICFDRNTGFDPTVSTDCITVNVADNGDTPKIAVQVPGGVPSPSVLEDAFDAVLEVLRVPGFGDGSSNVAVTLALQGGTATPGVDFDWPGYASDGSTILGVAQTRVVTVPDGVWSTTVRVRITNDTLFETPDEAFIVGITGVTNLATIDAARQSVTVRIADDGDVSQPGRPLKPVVSQTTGGMIQLSLRGTDPSNKGGTSQTISRRRVFLVSAGDVIISDLNTFQVPAAMQTEVPLISADEALVGGLIASRAYMFIRYGVCVRACVSGFVSGCVCMCV